VSYVRENSPAARAGIMVGDKLEYVSGITGEKLTIAAIHDDFYKLPNKTIRV
jgi:predicted metalloprotease with PDZ domain